MLLDRPRCASTGARLPDVARLLASAFGAAVPSVAIADRVGGRPGRHVRPAGRPRTGLRRGRPPEWPRSSRPAASPAGGGPGPVTVAAGPGSCCSASARQGSAAQEPVQRPRGAIRARTRSPLAIGVLADGRDAARRGGAARRRATSGRRCCPGSGATAARPSARGRAAGVADGAAGAQARAQPVLEVIGAGLFEGDPDRLDGEPATRSRPCRPPSAERWRRRWRSPAEALSVGRGRAARRQGGDAARARLPDPRPGRGGGDRAEPGRVVGRPGRPRLAGDRSAAPLAGRRGPGRLRRRCRSTASGWRTRWTPSRQQAARGEPSSRSGTARSGRASGPVRPGPWEPVPSGWLEGYLADPASAADGTLGQRRRPRACASTADDAAEAAARAIWRRHGPLDAEPLARQARAAFDRTATALGAPRPPTSPEHDYLELRSTTLAVGELSDVQELRTAIA